MTKPPPQLVVLAGGMGTRLSSRTAGVPKALVPVDGVPVIDRQIDLAASYGVRDVLLLLGHRSDDVRRWASNRSRDGVSVEWLIESEPRGTGGALLDARKKLAERFLLFFVDQVMDMDLGRLLGHHDERGNAVTVVVHPNDHPYDSDLIQVDAEGRVVAVLRPPHDPGSHHRNIVNAATYVIDRSALNWFPEHPGKCDLARDLLPQMIDRGTIVGAYASREYLKDMGTPDRLERVEADVRSGAVGRRHLRNRLPAILLDRDGTINHEVGRISNPSDLQLIPGVAAAVGRANRAAHLVAVVTNQPVVARGDCTEGELERIHGCMEGLLAESKAYLDGIYVCPHHPDRGFEGERVELKGPCGCRKPTTGLVIRADRDLMFDPARTWLVGDSSTDVACAMASGLIPGLVATGHSGADRRHPLGAAVRFVDAAHAIEFILDSFPALWRRCQTVAAGFESSRNILVRGPRGSGVSTLARLLAHAVGRVCRPVELHTDSDLPVTLGERDSQEMAITIVDGGSAAADDGRSFDLVMETVVDSAARAAIEQKIGTIRQAWPARGITGTQQLANTERLSDCPPPPLARSVMP